MWSSSNPSRLNRLAISCNIIAFLIQRANNSDQNYILKPKIKCPSFYPASAKLPENHNLPVWLLSTEITAVWPGWVPGKNFEAVERGGRRLGGGAGLHLTDIWWGLWDLAINL